MTRTAHDLVVTPQGLRFRGHRFACTVGRGGVRNDKREGDGATPRGTHSIVGMLFRPDRIAPPTSWATPILPGDLWSDDAHEADYNQMVRAPYKGSHETLRRADPMYDLVILTDWNWPAAQSGKGSAIFIHQYRRPGFPTAGCIGLSRSNLYTIAQRITPETRLVVL